jgi:hypothetical protein
MKKVCFLFLVFVSCASNQPTKNILPPVSKWELLDSFDLTPLHGSSIKTVTDSLFGSTCWQETFTLKESEEWVIFILYSNNTGSVWFNGERIAAYNVVEKGWRILDSNSLRHARLYIDSVRISISAKFKDTL